MLLQILLNIKIVFILLILFIQYKFYNKYTYKIVILKIKNNKRLVIRVLWYRRINFLVNQMFEQFFENINYVYNCYYLRKNYTFKKRYYF